MNKLLNEVFSEENTGKLDQLRNCLAWLSERKSGTIERIEFIFGKRALVSLDLFSESDSKEALVNNKKRPLFTLGSVYRTSASGVE